MCGTTAPGLADRPFPTTWLIVCVRVSASKADLPWQRYYEFKVVEWEKSPFSSVWNVWNSAQLTQAQGFGILYGAWWLLYYCRYRTRNKSKPLAFLLIYYDTYGRFLCTSARESEMKVCMQQAERVVCGVEWVRYTCMKVLDITLLLK